MLCQPFIYSYLEQAQPLHVKNIIAFMKIHSLYLLYIRAQDDGGKLGRMDAYNYPGLFASCS